MRDARFLNPRPRGTSLLAAILIASAAPADTIDWAVADGWDISFYPGSAGCQAFALLQENTAFFIGYDTTGGQVALDITMLNKTWTEIDEGIEYEVRLRFGEQPSWTLAMDGIHLNGLPGLNILIDTQSAGAKQFINEFRNERMMQWALPARSLGRFSLDGSRNAFREIGACQEHFETKALQSPALTVSTTDKD